MIQLGSIFNVIDNTGVKKILCINILNSKSTKIKLEDIIIGVIKDTKNNKNFKKSMIVRGLVVRIKLYYNIKTGKSYLFKNNAVILIDNNCNPLGNRILGVIPKIFKEKYYMKISSISSEFI
uniref:50S ribosomal protein L14 n=1 Tax=Nephromyces sp. ex Molgula occidentalis TaxID=2544991 RepID=A0A5C1H811_9APIC|nr:50S ribosomal protein L14 [Nephromyces sp. ex Molgula occidentalis]